MSQLQDPIHRRDFLGTLLATASVGAAGLSLPIANAFASVPPSPSDSDFEQWLGKIKGKHRQVFDAPEPNSGLPYIWARVFMMTNKTVGADEKDVTAVIVLRHNAIALGLNTQIWEKYNFADQFKVTNFMTKEVLKQNPFWNPPEGAFPLPGLGADQLQASGALIGMCDMALTVMSQEVGEKMKMDPAEVKKDWVSGIFPGIQVVPSGVLAVNRAQEHKCTYCYAGG
jgi:hypothetical protein